MTRGQGSDEHVSIPLGPGGGGGGDEGQQEEHPRVSLGKKWSQFPGKNRFYCDGRLMTAPSTQFCGLCFLLILVTYTLFIAFDGPFLAQRLTIAIPIIGSLIFLVVIINMLHTSCSDPGIIPRATVQESEYIDRFYANASGFRPPPRTRDIVVNGQTIKSKYCFTCKMFRPPRASHCGVCDNCVERFDHHCPMLGNCIGRRNYRNFYAFVVSLSCLAVFVLSCSIVHLVLLSKDKGNFLEALRETPTSAVVVLISFFGMWTVIGLAGFHTYLIAVEQTTNEDIKGLFGRANAKNPYSRGNLFQNCCFVLCGPIRPSLIDARGELSPDYIESYTRKQTSPTRPPTTHPPRGSKCKITQQCQEKDSTTHATSPNSEGPLRENFSRAGPPNLTPGRAGKQSTVATNGNGRLASSNVVQHPQQGLSHHNFPANHHIPPELARSPPPRVINVGSKLGNVGQYSAGGNMGVKYFPQNEDRLEDGGAPTSVSMVQLESYHQPLSAKKLLMNKASTESLDSNGISVQSAPTLPTDTSGVRQVQERALYREAYSQNIANVGSDGMNSMTMINSPLHLDPL